jgi:hypothetical protein
MCQVITEEKIKRGLSYVAEQLAAGEETRDQLLENRKIFLQKGLERGMTGPELAVPAQISPERIYTIVGSTGRKRGLQGKSADELIALIDSYLDVVDRSQITLALDQILSLVHTRLRINQKDTPRAFSNFRLIVQEFLMANLQIDIASDGYFARKLTLADIPTFLQIPEFRAQVLALSRGRAVKTFFGPQGTYDSLSPAARTESFGLILRRLSTLQERQAGEK